MRDDILIINGSLLPLGAHLPDYLQSGYVAIKDGKIRELGPMKDLPLPYNCPSAETTVLDATDTLVMPGLINAHTHAAMTLFRGLADDLPLMTWLQEHIFPAEARCVNPEMVYWCTKLAGAEMLLSGTTTVADGYFHEEAAAKAFLETGLRAVASQGVLDYPAPGVPDPAKNIETAADFIRAWQDKYQLVTPAVFCHSPYTCSSDTLRRAKGLARRSGVHYFIHVAETKDEARQIQEQHGTSPVRYLADLGILDEGTVCVHCVWLDSGDLDIIAQTGANIALCPESNMKLASGIAPVKEMLKRGISLGLGTDGCASNNNLDLFTEMDTCAKLHKVHSFDPTVLPARQVLKMATIGGAKVLGLEEITGDLTPGKQADIILINLRQPHLTPFYNPDLLVYAAGGADVVTSIVGGRIVMKDRKILTFDIEEAISRVNTMSSAAKNLCFPKKTF